MIQLDMKIDKGKIFYWSNWSFFSCLILGFLCSQSFYSIILPFLRYGLLLFLIIALIFFLFKKRKYFAFFITLFFIIASGFLGLFLIHKKKNPHPLGNILDLQDYWIEGKGILGICLEKKGNTLQCEIEKLIVLRKNNIKESLLKSEQKEKTYTGKIIFKTKKENLTNKRLGDNIFFSGKIKGFSNYSNFDLNNYYLTQNIFASLETPNFLVQKASLQKGQRLSVWQKSKRFLAITKIKIQNNIKNLWTNPTYQGLAQAFILGDKSGFSDELNENFKKTGVSHLVAVSGMHLEIIFTIMAVIFFNLGFSRNVVFSLSILVVFSLTILINSPASATRALIAGILVMTVKYFGRKGNANKILLWTGNFMLLFNPMILFFDVGFQLSFLAVWGIINLNPIIFKYLNFLKINLLKEALSVSLSAQIAVLPLLVFHFQYISLVSPLVNVLVFWISFPLIFFIIAAIFTSSISLFLAKELVFITNLIFQYLLLVVNFFSSFSWAGITLENNKKISFLIYSFVLLFSFNHLIKIRG